MKRNARVRLNIMINCNDDDKKAYEHSKHSYNIYSNIYKALLDEKNKFF